MACSTHTYARKRWSSLTTRCLIALACCGQVNAQNALELLQDNTDGDIGLYLKQVDGPVTASFRSNAIFEPASAIKVLVHAHVMREVQTNPDVSLADIIAWNADASKFSNGVYQPGGADCAANNAVPQTSSLSQSLRWMMEASDNALTQALRDVFGDVDINTTRLALGMVASRLDHSIGCGDQILVNPNQLTLEDAGRLHELVAIGFLNEPTRATFYDLMTNGLPGNLGNIINQEAAKQGKSNLASDFVNSVRTARKGGSYDWANRLYRSEAGWGSFPLDFGNTSREFVYGAFIDNATTLDAQNSGSNVSIGNVEAELLRLAVRGALHTWKVPGLVSPGIQDSIGDLTRLKTSNPRAPYVPNLDAAIASLNEIADSMSRPVGDFDANILALSATIQDLENAGLPRDSFFDVLMGLGANAQDLANEALAVAATLGTSDDLLAMINRSEANLDSAASLLEAAARGRGTFHQAVQGLRDAVRVVAPSLQFETGDVNYDGALDVDDIDAITRAVIARSNSPHYDLDDDGFVDQDDRLIWVDRIYRTYLGDSNLDGEFNSTDFVDVFVRAKYEDNIPGNATWGDGDWDGNGDFDSGDFVAAFIANGYEMGPRVAFAVPEPACFACWWGCLAALCWRFRRR